MTAWTVLTGNSTLPVNGVNTAWLHLNNQQAGGGGGTPYPVYLTEIQAQADLESVAASDNNTVAQTDNTVVAIIDSDTILET